MVLKIRRQATNGQMVGNDGDVLCVQDRRDDRQLAESEVWICRGDTFIGNGVRLFTSLAQIPTQGQAQFDEGENLKTGEPQLKTVPINGLLDGYHVTYVGVPDPDGQKIHSGRWEYQVVGKACQYRNGVILLAMLTKEVVSGRAIRRREKKCGVSIPPIRMTYGEKRRQRRIAQVA